MNNMRYGEGLKIVPLLSVASTDSTVSAFVKVSQANWITFLIHEGANDTTSTITIECCTSNSTSGAALVAVPFSYRLGPEMGTDSGWGAITTVDSAGYALTSDYANVSLLIDIDPQDLAADTGLDTAEYYYLRANIACTSYAGNVISVFAFLEPRWKMLDMISAS